MDQARLIRIAVMLCLGGALLGEYQGPFKSPADDASEQSEWRRFSERNAGGSLKTLPELEGDSRANDGDWCHGNDFWTDEVQGLYPMTSTEDEEWSNYLRQILN